MRYVDSPMPAGRRLLVPLLLAALVATPSCRRLRSATSEAEPRPVTARGDLAADERATIDLFRQSSPSVVFITTLSRRRTGLFRIAEIPRGEGSGTHGARPPARRPRCTGSWR